MTIKQVVEANDELPECLLVAEPHFLDEACIAECAHRTAGILRVGGVDLSRAWHGQTGRSANQRLILSPTSADSPPFRSNLVFDIGGSLQSKASR